MEIWMPSECSLLEGKYPGVNWKLQVEVVYMIIYIYIYIYMCVCERERERERERNPFKQLPVLKDNTGQYICLSDH